MAKERIVIQFLKHLLFLVCPGLLLFSSEIRGAVNPGNVIVNNAKGYIGRSYVWGAPTNKEEEYGGGGIFAPEGEYLGGFDCSGLVSWCAGLRKHYFTSELPILTDSIGWESLQPGDLLLGSGHVLVFEKWRQKEGTNTTNWETTIIHAVTKLQIGAQTIVINKVEERNLLVSFLKSKGWLPHRFKNDTKPPVIKFDGAENEKHYNHDVTLTVNGRDYIEGPTYAYGLYKEKKFKTKTFKDEGKYEITGKAIDWAKNEKEEKITFGIDKTKPQISITSPSEEEWLNKNTVNIKGKVEDPLKNNYASGQGTCPAPELFYDVYKHHLIV